MIATMMRLVLALGLLGCSGRAATTATASHVPKPSTVDAPDAVVGKHFIYGVRGHDPEVVRWSGTGRVFFSER